MASSNNYYEFRDAKVLIALDLMKKGWKVFGFHEDNSDAMTDYYDPAYWDGIATKNGYVVVVDCYDNHRSGKEIKVWTGNSERAILSEKVQELIRKLKEVRQDRGASAAEEATAKEKIENLMKKASESKEGAYEVTDHYPEYQANPPRMSWHVEKDGTIIAKGNGVAKFSRLRFFDLKRYQADLENYADNKESYRYQNAKELIELNEKFIKFMNKIDTAAGAMLGGEGDAYVYENITVTEYKTEKKAVEKPGKIQNGQCFIIKGNFNHGICKGYVYKLVEMESKGVKLYHAVRLNGKLDKMLTGLSNPANSFGYLTDNTNDGFTKKFMGWVEKGIIAWCDIEEIKTPYEVQKCIKKRIQKEDSAKADKTSNNNEYKIIKDVDTRDNSEIYVVKVKNSLSKEDFAELRKEMKEKGGYYSRFKKGFIFTYDPTEELAA